MFKRKVLLSLVLSGLIAGSFTGCEDDDNIDDSNAVSIQSMSDYATRSSSDYSENKYGLISAVNAVKMITDWETNKPEGKRKLFIMQYGNIYGFDGNHTEQTSAGVITLGNGYIKTDKDAGVYVFDRTSGCTDTGDFRGDGVSSVPKPVFSIEQMDAAFGHYGIDPDKDVLMLALGSPDQAKAGNYLAGVARMWYTLTYWGFPQESIMMLNGQASHVLNPKINADVAGLNITKDDIFTSLPSDPDQNLTQGVDWNSISTVKRDGTILQATMEDMMNVVERAQSSDFIIDARSAAEYDGTKQAKTEYTVCGANKDEQCYTAFDGHIRGAKNVYYTDVMSLDDGATDINDDNVTDYRDASFSFKSLGTIEGIFTDLGFNRDTDTVYTYCRTGTKASLLTFTSSAVLGYKTRIYDGSWIQWGKMANVTDTNGDTLLPADSKWLTDNYSESVVYNPDSIKVSPLNQELLNLDGEHTNQIINEDKAAK